MDLSRWNLPKFSRWADRYRGFQDFLGEVLEGERSLLRSSAETARPEAPFEVRDDFERLLLSPVPSRGNGTFTQAETLFESLAPYFEAGFQVLLPEGAAPKLKSMFLYGRVFVPPDAESAEISFKPPTMHVGQVMKGRVQPLLRSFRLAALRSLNEASVFAFRPEPGTMYLVICNRPHPWQVGAIEQAHLVISEIFDRAAREAQRKQRRSFSKGLFR